MPRDLTAAAHIPAELERIAAAARRAPRLDEEPPRLVFPTETGAEVTFHFTGLPEQIDAAVTHVRTVTPAATLDLLRRIARLERQLELAAGQFDFYARQHAAKQAPGSAEKAETNRRWANDCRATVGDRTIPRTMA